MGKRGDILADPEWFCAWLFDYYCEEASIGLEEGSEVRDAGMRRSEAFRLYRDYADARVSHLRKQLEPRMKLPLLDAALATMSSADAHAPERLALSVARRTESLFLDLEARTLLLKSDAEIEKWWTGLERSGRRLSLDEFEAESAKTALSLPLGLPRIFFFLAATDNEGAATMVP